MQKDILFYSNLCDYSQKLLQLIAKKELKQHFMCVCVDKNYKLPEFVDRVPIIYTKYQDVLFDEAIVKYIEQISNQQSEIVEAYMFSGGSSDSYSFLDNSDTLAGKNYTTIGYQTNMKPIAQQNEKFDTSSDKLKGDEIEQYMQARAADTARIASEQRVALAGRL